MSMDTDLFTVLLAVLHIEIADSLHLLGVKRTVAVYDIDNINISGEDHIKSSFNVRLLSRRDSHDVA